MYVYSYLEIRNVCIHIHIYYFIVDLNNYLNIVLYISNKYCLCNLYTYIYFTSSSIYEIV